VIAVAHQETTAPLSAHVVDALQVRQDRQLTEFFARVHQEHSRSQSTERDIDVDAPEQVG